MPSRTSIPELAGRAADRLGHLEAAAGGEDGQPPEQPPAGVFEEVIAPGDRTAQGLLPFGQVAGAAGQHGQLVPEPFEDRLGRQELDPRCGQLDRQGHALEPSDDAGHRRGVLDGQAERRLDRGRPGDEQADRLVAVERGRIRDPQLIGQLRPPIGAEGRWIRRRRQARHRVLLLARYVEGGSTRDDHLQLARRPEELSDQRRGLDHLLEIVEDEQDLAGADPAGQAVADRDGAVLDESQDRGDRRSDEGRLANRFEGDEVDAVGEALGDRRRELEGQAGLAGAARAGQGEQAGRAQHRAGLLELGGPADERGDLGRQVVRPAVERADRARIIGQALDLEDCQPLGAEVLQAVFAQVTGAHAGRQPVAKEGHGRR